MSHAETAAPVDLTAASMLMGGGASDALRTLGYYTVQCVGADGLVKWEDVAHNTVTTEGKNAILDKFLDLGAAYAAIAIGLHTTVGNASSTYATPSPQVESTVYSNSTRGVPSFSAASSGAKATSSAVSFTINGSATITGCFLALGASGVTTKGDTAATAILLSSGTFTGGSRAVISGDTLNVSYTLTLT